MVLEPQRSINGKRGTPTSSGTCIGALPCLSSSSRFSRFSTEAVAQLDSLLCVGESKGPLDTSDRRKLRHFGRPIPRKRRIDLGGRSVTGIEIFKLVRRRELEEDVVRPAVLLSFCQHVGNTSVVGLLEQPSIPRNNSSVWQEWLLDQNFVRTQEIGHKLAINVVCIHREAVHEESICRETSEAVGVVAQRLKQDATSHEGRCFK